MRFWLGGYSADMDGTGSGIGVLHAGGAAEQSASGALAFAGTAVTTSSPSWLAAHPTLPVVYATLEGDGTVQAFRRTGLETLVVHGPAVVTGEFTCHAAVSPDGTLLVATAYGDGSVAFIPLTADGALGEAIFGALPTDPHAGVVGGGRIDDPNLGALTASGFALAGTDAPAPRPETTDVARAADALRAAVGSEFAHLVPSYTGDDGDEFARFLAEQDLLLLGPDATERRLAGDVAAAIIADAAPVAKAPEAPEGRVPHAHQARFLSRGVIATTDLGFDLVRLWARSARGFVEIQSVALPQGSGPRHMVWHPSGHLHVVTEYSCEVFTLAPDDAGRWRILAATPVSREAVVGADFPSELSSSASGEHLYAGVRGSNTIATLAVKENGTRLVPVAAVDTHVDWPRHHVLVRDVLLIAGQRSDTVAALTIDERSQLPTVRRSITDAPTPTALLPVFD
ncbi:lactonase family protein [Microbacterium gorillae]|uniref:lactonase family protein n=1 Tax=Microbacterium gorillae TaxID=1231063 RepID=UPI00058F04A0|nr:beta-propeller fold lactonase family protein [Microbacterium gorillae]